MQEANLKLFCRWVCCCWVYPHCLFSSLVSCKCSFSATKVLLVQCCVHSAGIFVGLRTGPGCCWSVHRASAKDSAYFAAEVLRIHGVLLRLGMCATHGPCHCNWATLFYLAAEAPGCSALESTFAPSLGWQLTGAQMASVSAKNGASRYLFAFPHRAEAERRCFGNFIVRN